MIDRAQVLAPRTGVRHGKAGSPAVSAKQAAAAPGQKWQLRPAKGLRVVGWLEIPAGTRPLGKIYLLVNLLRLLATRVLVLGVLFGCAGRWDLPFFWAYVALFTVSVLALSFTMDQALHQERLRPPAGGKDRLLGLLLLPFVVARLGVAGLDAGRFHWSNVPFAVQMVAFAGLAAFATLALSAMVVNRFFSPAVRIQRERGHNLITTGPYRYIRHPGYAAMVFTGLCSGPALGSWWAMLPTGVYAILIIRRAALEDRFLRKELKGYADYARRVRYRLVPGLW
jgi:protein-S-isoprenylcysteine O-methyltransferase Ste14